MNELLDYSFLSWTQFAILAVVAFVILLLVNRFHLFDKHSWNTSVGYHMFFCTVLSIVIMAFLGIRPIFHIIFLFVIFGVIYKNFFAYIRAIFNLYFSNIRMGDRVRINNTEGTLNNINIGGMHILANEEKSFFPFSGWKGEKIVLLSENGQIPVAISLKDKGGRSQRDAFLKLEKCLFLFPYLADYKVDIKIHDQGMTANVFLSAEQYKESLVELLASSGFTVNQAKNS